MTDPDHAEAERTEAPTFGHVPGLDGLRGMAVLAVLLYHAGHMRGGYLGVDLFFVLSGYLITSLLLVEHQRSGGIDLRAFWGRRMRRLLPALLLLLAGAAVYAQAVARPVDYAGIRGDAIATLAYVANWHTILSGSSYWDLSLAPSPLQHTWSLAIEEQFYVVWPLVVWAVVRVVRRRGPQAATDVQARLERAIGIVAAVGTVLSFALLIGLHHLGSSTTRIYEGTDTRAGATLGGVALAVWAKRRRDREAAGEQVRSVVSIEVLGVGAAGVLGVLWFRLDGQSPALYQGLLPVASVLAVLVIAAVADPRSPVLGRVLANPVARGLGMISYGLYLAHWPIYQALEALNGAYPGLGDRTLDGGGLLVAKLVLSLVVALLSYLLVEQPIRHGRLPRRARVPVGVVAAALTMVLVVVATRTDVTGPATEQVAQRADTVGGAPTVLVVGDSVALSVVRPMVERPTEFGVNPINATRVGCAEVTAGLEVINFAGRAMETPVPCRVQVEGRLADFDPDVVFLEIGARPNDFLRVDGVDRRACDPVWDARYRSRMGSAVDLLGSTGAPVGVSTVLHSGANSLRVEGSEDRIDCVNESIRAVVAERPGAFLVDVDAFVCPQGAWSCRETIDGGSVRSDGLHFDPGPGGDAVTNWIIEQLLTEGLGR